jgi:hypothetical protein
VILYGDLIWRLTWIIDVGGTFAFAFKVVRTSLLLLTMAPFMCHMVVIAEVTVTHR